MANHLATHTTVSGDHLLAQARDILPIASTLATVPALNGSAEPQVLVVSVPNNHQLHRQDLREFHSAPQRIKAQATADDLDTLLGYLHRHASSPANTVWVSHNPRTSELTLVARLNDNSGGTPAWADHTVTFTPRLSVEWGRWTKANSEHMSQLDFANFLEDNLGDIYPGDAPGMPSAGDMLQMAVAFESVQDMRVKSHARTQDGGIRLEFADAADDSTAKKMEAFARFQIALPVFYGGARFPITAKLRFNARKAVPEFWFDLIRPDATHLAASLDLIARLRDALQSEQFKDLPIPVLMGKA